MTAEDLRKRAEEAGFTVSENPYRGGHFEFTRANQVVSYDMLDERVSILGEAHPRRRVKSPAEAWDIIAGLIRAV